MLRPYGGGTALECDVGALWATMAGRRDGVAVHGAEARAGITFLIHQPLSVLRPYGMAFRAFRVPLFRAFRAFRFRGFRDLPRFRDSASLPRPVPRLLDGATNIDAGEEEEADDEEDDQ
jgi:hypothetical protein